eukprot:jgi/Chlat1/5188/Chrsp33S05168
MSMWASGFVLVDTSAHGQLHMLVLVYCKHEKRGAARLRRASHPAHGATCTRFLRHHFVGAVMDPVLMVVPFDDHMQERTTRQPKQAVHRGHTVASCAMWSSAGPQRAYGSVYSVFDRYERSCTVRLPLPATRQALHHTNSAALPTSARSTRLSRVHRGHAVFDTCNVVPPGRAYGLRVHLDRLERSCAAVRLPLPAPRQALHHTILHTIAASGQTDAFVKYWVSAGVGGFGISSQECVRSNFYVMVHKSFGSVNDVTEGISEITVRDEVVPVKPILLATAKTTNYVSNALLAMEAESRGGHYGIHIKDGYVLESSVMNVAIVTREGELCTPQFDNILRGCTAVRVLELATQLLSSQSHSDLKGVTVRPVAAAELRTATEVMLLGGSGVVPVVRLDGHDVGDGKVGPVAQTLIGLMRADMAGEGDGRLHLDDVPYAEYNSSSIV